MPSVADLLPAGLRPEDAVAMLAFAAALVVFLLLWRGLVEHDPLPARLKALEGRRTQLKSALLAPKRSTRRTDVAGWTTLLLRHFRRSRGRMVAALQLSLARAGMRSRQALAWALFARFAAPVAGALAALGLLYGLGKPAVPGMLKPLAVVAVAVAAGFAPGIFVANRAQKRREAIRKQLADAFDLMVICAEAGLSLDAALDRVARETVQGAPELSDEIALTSIELSFLPDRQKALSGLADRVPLPAVRALINTLVQTERYGTPLAQALRVLAAELRDERMMRAEEKAARLPAVMTIPMVSFILPPLFLVLIGPAILRTIDGLRGLHH
jgi:tight adherence protein C